MAASTSLSAPNIVKILINYSEYTRLKDIEEKYNQLQRKYKEKLHIEEGNIQTQKKFIIIDKKKLTYVL
jgi:hypothetical protein